MNRYPMWKYALIAIVLIAGALYALPNLFGKDFAVQVSPTRAQEIDSAVAESIEGLLRRNNIEIRGIETEPQRFQVRVADGEAQEQAAELIQEELGRNYTVAYNLAPATPAWLQALGGDPMVLGLDLQGGVHFLMQVDMDTARAQQEERLVDDMRAVLREADIRAAVRQESDGVTARFRSAEDRDRALSVIAREIPDMAVDSLPVANERFPVRGQLTDEKLEEVRTTALQQNLTTLRNRVNELGVAEPLVQQQGADRIVVQLPGVQDTAAAKDIIGATATLEYRAVDEQNNPITAAQTGILPPGTRLYQYEGQPILLKRRIIVSGDQLVDAGSGYDPTNGQPQVNVTLNNVGAKRMLDFTKENVGMRMAVVYREIRPVTREVDGETVKRNETIEEVISVATVQGVFGRRFRTTGLDSPQESSRLALLLRAGALAAPVEIIEERTVGPSLGQDNIDRGKLSVMVGFVLVLIFMAIYYRVFGLVADVALFVNLVLIMALLSLLGATLTLPGIAGIVLTVGMAVDANVLIFERIREELRNGNTPQASIRAGYEKAFSTIADANVTTLIAAVVLFSFGTGPIKGFAITLSLGIVTSMFTAIMGTRALINLIYGRRQRVASLAI